MKPYELASKMRKAFSLVEVLVASSIASLVGLALLQNHSNNAKLIQTMSQKYQVKEEFSLVLLNADAKFDGSDKLLYDMVASRFKIKDDEFISYLKSKKFSYSHDELSSINLLDMDLEELEGLETQNIPKLNLLIDKLSIKATQGSAFGYLVSVE